MTGKRKAAPAKEKRKPGKPSKYTDAILQEICDRLSTGETLADICRSEHMPSYWTIMDWQRNNEHVSANIGRAREIGFDVIAARTRQTARGVGDSSGDVQRDKLIVETDLKLLAKWSKRYCDRFQHDIGNQDGKAFQTESRVTMAPDESYRAMLDGGS